MLLSNNFCFQLLHNSRCVTFNVCSLWSYTVTDMENKSILRDHNQQTLCPLDVPLCNDGPKYTAKQFQVVGSVIRWIQMTPVKRFKQFYISCIISHVLSQRCNSANFKKFFLTIFQELPVVLANGCPRSFIWIYC